jgi:tetratricopeptide (TPR) repeat protein
VDIPGKLTVKTASTMKYHIQMLSTYNKYIFLGILLFLSANSLLAQNTIGGKAVQVPEAEVNRQSAFLDAERERILSQYDKAIALYKKFLYNNDKEDAAWYGLARSYEAKEEMSNAIESAQKALTLAPDNQWYSIYLGDLYEKTGRTKDAIKIYEGLTKRFPNTPEFYQQLAYLAVRSGDPQTGLKSLERLEKITGISEKTSESKHLIYIGLNDNKKAAAELQKLADAYPRELDYRLRLARFYEAIGDTNGARRTYEEVLRYDPDNGTARLALAGTTTKSKDPGASARRKELEPLFANPTVPIDDKIKELLPIFGELSKNNNPALAQDLVALSSLLEKAHPNDPKAWSCSGDALYFSDQSKAALEKYKKCISLNPNVFTVWENTMTILHSQSNWAELATTAEKAMEAFPNKPASYLHYGAAATELGKLEDALSALQQAELMVGNNTRLQIELADQIGVTCTRKKDYPAAIAAFEKALSAGGDKSARLMEHYGDALYHSGDAAKAQQMWQKAAAIQKNPALEQKISSGKI